MIGIIGIPNKVFALWNILGAVIWTDGILLLGYLLGEKIEGSVDKYLLPMVGLIIFLSLLPIIIDLLRRNNSK
jgi:membrane-associated protein